MHRILTLSLWTLFAIGLHAQDGARETIDVVTTEKDNIREAIGTRDSAHWTYGGFGSLQFGQVALVNWSQGGESSISATAVGNAFLDYRKGHHFWNTTFDGQWGIQKIKGQSARKNADFLELNSKYGYRVQKHLYASTLLNFRSQFSRTWAFDDATGDRIEPYVSRFLSPATLQIGLGVDYVPTDWFSVYVSPATGKFTFVADPAVDETLYGLDPGDAVRAEFGAYLRAQFNKEIMTNVSVRSMLELFNNYTDPNKENRVNIDVNWQTGIDFKINEWLVTSLFLHLIYDHDQAVPKVDDDGNPVFLSDPDTGQVYDVQQNTVLTQFRQTFSLGLTYKFGNGE